MVLSLIVPSKSGHTDSKCQYGHFIFNKYQLTSQHIKEKTVTWQIRIVYEFH